MLIRFGCILIQDSDNKYNLVFLRSPNTNSNYLQNANPIVYLDKNSNKLVIKVRTVQADTLTFNNLDDLIQIKHSQCC